MIRLKIATIYVRVVDQFNYYIGRVMMYGIFALMWPVIAKRAFTTPPFWMLEVAYSCVIGAGRGMS
ncbi:hypothetical protein [Profundibacter sp.]